MTYLYDFISIETMVRDRILEKFGDKVKYICVGSEQDSVLNRPRLNVQILLYKVVETAVAFLDNITGKLNDKSRRKMKRY